MPIPILYLFEASAINIYFGNVIIYSYNVKLSSVFFQLTQTNPPEFMGSTLKELGIGTYQNVAVVGGHTLFYLF